MLYITCSEKLDLTPAQGCYDTPSRPPAYTPGLDVRVSDG